jgi:hypothetical protein
MLNTLHATKDTDPRKLLKKGYAHHIIAGFNLT